MKNIVMYEKKIIEREPKCLVTTFSMLSSLMTVFTILSYKITALLYFMVVILKTVPYAWNRSIYSFK